MSVHNELNDAEITLECEYLDSQYQFIPIELEHMKHTYMSSLERLGKKSKALNKFHSAYKENQQSLELEIEEISRLEGEVNSLNQGLQNYFELAAQTIDYIKNLSKEDVEKLLAV